jgi:hypothetical protein
VQVLSYKLRLCSKPMGVSNDVAAQNVDGQKGVKSDGGERDSYRRSLLRYSDFDGGRGADMGASAGSPETEGRVNWGKRCGCEVQSKSPSRFRCRVDQIGTKISLLWTLMLVLDPRIS